MNTLLWKRRIGEVAGHLPRFGGRRVVLLYHSVGDSPWAVREADFREQVHWLDKLNAEVCSLDALLRDEMSRGVRVALTFDDGYASLADIAADILSAASMTATVYLNAGLIDQHSRRLADVSAGHYPAETFLSWEDVRRLRAQGWTIGSHGVEHLDLTMLPPDRVASELADSKAMIEERTGISCDHFSYTWGRNSAPLRSAVKEAGYRYAAAAVHGAVKPGFDPLAIPRINIHRDYSIEDFSAIVRGNWDFLGWWQRARSRTA
jgi:peptidoglycan/xylan/chitin deacetylase (PgdA/CDA1 family)